MDIRINDTKEISLFKAVKSRKLSDEIFEQIKALIFKGDIKPGEKLPPERELAEYLNVGRSSLREALIQLSAVGLIEARKTEGYYVRSVTEELVGPLKSFIEEEIRNLIDILEVRKMLDIYCANEALKKGTNEDFDKIGEALEQGDNTRFHLAIVESSHNVILYHVMSNMYDLLSTLSFIKKRRKVNVNIYAKQHRNIYDAIKKKESEAVKKAIEEHVDFFINAAKTAEIYS